MQLIAEAHNATVRAVATSAVREAHNSDVFLSRAYREAKVDIEVISGLEEARLIHLGVLQAVPASISGSSSSTSAVASTEVLVGERGDTLAARSFKLGAVRLTDRFFPGGATRPIPSASAVHTFARSWPRSNARCTNSVSKSPSPRRAPPRPLPG